jgi:hypothetical protein
MMARPSEVVLYHRALPDRAAVILARGFGDGRGTPLHSSERFVGVWLTECFLDADPDRPAGNVIDGSVLVAVTIPAARLPEHELAGHQSRTVSSASRPRSSTATRSGR